MIHSAGLSEGWKPAAMRLEVHKLSAMQYDCWWARSSCQHKKGVLELLVHWALVTCTLQSCSLGWGSCHGACRKVARKCTELQFCHCRLAVATQSQGITSECRLSNTTSRKSQRSRQMWHRKMLQSRSGIPSLEAPPAVPAPLPLLVWPLSFAVTLLADAPT